MKYNRINIFLCLVLVLLSAASAARPIVNNNFQKLPSPEYDPLSSAITEIVQDDEVGFIWVGSRKGLYCYNGTEYREVGTVNRALSTNLRLHITELCFDQRGWLWIGTRKGVLVYNPSRDEIIKTNGSNILTNVIIRDLFASASGNMFIGSRNHLFIYDAKENGIKDVTPSLRKARWGKDPYFFHSFCKGNDSSIWLSCSYGLLKYNDNNTDYANYEFYGYQEAFGASVLLKQSVLLHKAPDGKILLGCEKGLYILDFGKKSITPYPYTINTPYSNIRALTFDYKNRLWIGTLNGILVTENYGDPTLLSYTPEKTNSLSSDLIHTIYPDNNNVVWVGTFYGGVNFWSGNTSGFLHISDKTPFGLSYKTVNSIAKDAQGNLYFGTEKKGVNIYNASKKRFTQITGLNNQMVSITVNDILVDANNLWLTTLTEGLIYYNLKTKSRKRYLIDKKINHPDQSFRNFILSIEKESDSAFMVGTFHQGLNSFNPNTGYYNYIPLLAFNSPQKTIPAIPQIKKDNNGDYWVVAEDDLFKLKRNTKPGTAFETTQIYNGNPVNGWINDVCITKDNTVWFSCPTNSMLKYANGNLTKVDLGRHINVLSIVEGHNNDLWLSTSVGIVHYNYKTEKHRVFDKSSGLIKNEFIRGAGIYAPNGNIYFGGASGVTFFNPLDITQTSNDSLKTRITGFLVYNKELTANDNSGILTSPIAYTNSLVLEHNQNMFTIKFSYGDLGVMHINNFEYRMVGFNNTWIRTNSPEVTYTLQSGGEYTFEVRYVNADGVSSPKTTQLQITLLNPLWKTPWAYSLYTLFILAIVWGLFNLYRSKTRLKYQLHIDAIAHEKQKELNEQKLRFFTNISHDFRTPLTLIIGTIEQFSKKFPLTSEMHQVLAVAQKNSRQLMSLINDLMDFRKLEKKQTNLSVSERNIVAYVQEVFLSFNNQAETNKYRYTFNCGINELKVFFDAQKMERVIYNLLSNAFKYTPPGGEITVEIVPHKNKVDLIFKDTGCGIEPEHLPNIFERFYAIKEKSARFTKGTGIGLTIAKNFVELHKGTLSVESQLNVGSTFTISLPLGNDHFEQADIVKLQSELEQIKLSQQALSSDDNRRLRAIVEDVLHKKDKKHTLLIAEDDEDLGLFLKDTLRDYFNVYLETNGLKAYQSVLNNPPDLIISDVMMPVMNGIEFCHKIKTNIETGHIPFVLLTARTALVYKYEGLESGADEYLSKPFQVKELLLKCANMLKTQENFRKKFMGTDEHGTNNSVNKDDEYIKALKILNANIANSAFGVNDLCEKMGLSRSVLYTKVKKWTGQSPGELLLGFRMKRAATLLEQQKYNVAEIANKTGYKQATYFTKCFKNYYKMLPSEYIKKFCE